MNRITIIPVIILALMAFIACSTVESERDGQSFGVPQRPGFEEIDTAELPQMDYCELRAASSAYDGVIVRISAYIANFGHGYYFDDQRCSKKFYNDLLDDDKTAVSFYEPRREELYETIKSFGYHCCLGEPLAVVAVGRFTRKYPTSGSDHMMDRTSFHFELFSIEPASKTINP